MNNCKTCKHWHNRQRELNYGKSIGLCLCPAMRFNTTDGRMLGIVDRENYRDRSKISGNPSHDIESTPDSGYSINSSRYSIATEELFGCLLHEPLPKK